MMSENTVTDLSRELKSIYLSGGPQIGVLTVPSLDEQTIEERAIQVFDQWKLGKKGKDNGVLILIAKRERKIRIEVGYGLEGDIPDARAKRIVEDLMLPWFRKGDFNSGVIIGVLQIAQLAHVNLKNLVISHAVPDSPPLPWQVKLFYILAGLFFLWGFLQPQPATGWTRRKRSYRESTWGGGGGGGWGSGGGGWGGGGGSSGGGGASGGW